MSDQPTKPRRSPPWAKLTRRRFLRGVLATAGAAAAATTVVEVVAPKPSPSDAAPRRFAGKTRWIGHC